MILTSNAKTGIVDLVEVPVASLVLLQDGIKGRITRTFTVNLEASVAHIVLVQTSNASQNGSNSLLVSGLSNNTIPDSITLVVKPGRTTSGLSDNNAIVSHISQFAILPNGGTAAPHPELTNLAPSTGASGFINAIIESPCSDEVQVEMSYVAHPIIYVPEYRIHETTNNSAEGGNPSSGFFSLRSRVNIFQFTGETWTNLVITEHTSGPRARLALQNPCHSVAAGQASTQVQSMSGLDQQEEIPLQRRDVVVRDQAFSEAEAIISRCLEYLRRSCARTWPRLAKSFSAKIQARFSTSGLVGSNLNSNSTEHSAKSSATARRNSAHPQSPQILHSLPERHQSILPTTPERQQGTQAGPTASASGTQLNKESEHVMRRVSPLSISFTSSPMWHGDHPVPRFVNGVRFNYRQIKMRLELVGSSGSSNVIPAEIILDMSQASQAAVESIFYAIPFALLATKPNDPEDNNVVSLTKTELQIKNTGPYDIFPGTLEIVLRGRDVHIKDWDIPYVPTGGIVKAQFFDSLSPESIPEAIRGKATSTGSIAAKSTRPLLSPIDGTARKPSSPSDSMQTFHTFSRTYTCRTKFTNASVFPASFEFVEDGTAIFNALVQDLVCSASSESSQAPPLSTPHPQQSHSSPLTAPSSLSGTPPIPSIDLPPFNVELCSDIKADNGSLEFALEQPHGLFEAPEEEIRKAGANQQHEANKGLSSKGQARTVQATGIWQLEGQPEPSHGPMGFPRVSRIKLPSNSPPPSSPWSPPLYTPGRKTEAKSTPKIRRASEVELLALDWSFSPSKSPRLVWKVELGPARAPTEGEGLTEQTVEVVSVWRLTARVNSALLGA